MKAKSRLTDSLALILLSFSEDQRYSYKFSEDNGRVAVPYLLKKRSGTCLIFFCLRCGAYSRAAVFLGRRLFTGKRLIPQRQNYSLSILHGLQGWSLPKLWLS